MCGTRAKQKYTIDMGTCVCMCKTASVAAPFACACRLRVFDKFREGPVAIYTYRTFFVSPRGRVRAEMFLVCVFRSDINDLVQVVFASSHQRARTVLSELLLNN